MHITKWKKSIRKSYIVCTSKKKKKRNFQAFGGKDDQEAWAPEDRDFLEQCKYSVWNNDNGYMFLSVQFSLSVISNSLQPHWLQHVRLLCPSSTPRACSNSCPLSQWCHPTISSSVTPFSSCLKSFPASGSFPMSKFFTSVDQSIGVSASTSVLPMNIQDWFPLGWTGWISLLPKGLSRVFPNTQFKSINSSVFSCPYSPTLTSIHDYWKNHSFH